MKGILIVLAFAVSMPSFAHGGQSQHSADDTARVVQAVMKLERKWVSAILRHDVKTMDRLLADDFIGVGSGGVVRDKIQTMADFRSSPASFTAIDLDEFNFRVDADSYVMSGRARVKVRLEDQELSQQFSYSKVYVKRRGRWQIIALHMARLTEE